MSSSPSSGPSSLLSSGHWKAAWRNYTPQERKHIILYIAGMMLYKIGYESFVGSITNLSLELWGGDERYGKLGTLHGLNLLSQCIGSILSAQVLRRFDSRYVLVVAVTTFAVVPALLMTLDKCTGGGIKCAHGGENPQHGKWDTNALFPLYCLSGVCYGVIELVKRVIPRDIVGGNADKLRQIDSLVHIFYESAGTGAAFLSSYLLVHLGSNYGMIMTPLCFVPAAMLWWLLGPLGFQKEPPESAPVSFLRSIQNAFLDFFRSILLGARLTFSRRAFAWLPVGYSLALYAHRYLENGLIPILAASPSLLHQPAFAPLLVGGSNLGELLGAFLVLVAGNALPTPMPWLRADALLLGLVWVFPFWRVKPTTTTTTEVAEAWKLAALFIPISVGWAAGDVSMVAYIQAAVPNDNAHPRISSLAAVMAFLYSIYIVVFAVLTPVLGRYADSSGDGRAAVLALGGVQFSVLAVVLMASTFVPRGSGRLNPKMEVEEGEEEGDKSDGGKEEEAKEGEGRTQRWRFERLRVQTSDRS